MITYPTIINGRSVECTAEQRRRLLEKALTPQEQIDALRIRIEDLERYAHNLSRLYCPTCSSPPGHHETGCPQDSL